MFQVHYAEHNGASPSQASLLITIWSLGNIIGRTLFGQFVNYFRKRILRIYQGAMFLSGLCTLLASISAHYFVLVAYVVLYGFLDGSFIGLLSLVTLEIVGMKNMAQGYGIMLFSIGVPISLGPPTIGKSPSSDMIMNDKKRASYYIRSNPSMSKM